MVMTVQVTGAKQIIRRLQSVQSLIITNSSDALSSAAKIFRDHAINNLSNRVGTGRWPSWGTSADGTSIRDKSNWILNKNNNTSLTLTCISPHAAVVEFGGSKTGSVFIESDRPYPIGKQQGANPLLRNKFAIQRGYHYATDAMVSQSTRNTMLNSISTNLRRVISGVGL